MKKLKRINQLKLHPLIRSGLVLALGMSSLESVWAQTKKATPVKAAVEEESVADILNNLNCANPGEGGDPQPIGDETTMGHIDASQASIDLSSPSNLPLNIWDFDLLDYSRRDICGDGTCNCRNGTGPTREGVKTDAYELIGGGCYLTYSYEQIVPLTNVRTPTEAGLDYVYSNEYLYLYSYATANSRVLRFNRAQGKWEVSGTQTVVLNKGYTLHHYYRQEAYCGTDDLGRPLFWDWAETAGRLTVVDNLICPNDARAKSLEQLLLEDPGLGCKVVENVVYALDVKLIKARDTKLEGEYPQNRRICTDIGYALEWSGHDHIIQNPSCQ